jgi:DNA-binding transcriptional LysR family regulator
MLDPRRLLTFLAVAEHGSFSRAADALSLTQSAVSQQVAALERGLGTRLLVRGRGVQEPTPAGAQLLVHARALADRLALADAQVAALVDSERRELRVGAFPSALATIVPAALAALLADGPDLDVRVDERRMDELVAGVRSGALHLALAFQDAAAPRREHPGTRRHDLFEEPFVAVMPARHRLARRREIALADLSAEPWTAPSRDGIIAGACRAAGFEPRIAYLSTDPLATRGLVCAGLAVTLVPRLLAGHLHGVHAVPVAGDPARRAVYAVLPDTGVRPLEQRLLAELQRVGGAGPDA